MESIDKCAEAAAETPGNIDRPLKRKDEQAKIRDKWIEMIDGLGVFASDGNRVVYKPLLTLLIFVRAQEKGENKFYFREIEPKLKQLMRQFSSSVRPKCNYPFWYLRSDGYWDVQTEFGDARTRKGKSSEPTAQGLRASRAYGTVPNALWHALVQDASLLAELAGKLIQDYWPSSIREDLAAALGIDLIVRKLTSTERDPDFRNKVLQAYNFQCAVCGFDGRISGEVFGIEAAHIQARSIKLGNGPDTVRNGIALCALHHKAFDYGAIGLDADLRILVSANVSGSHSVSSYLRNYANAELIWKPYQEGARPDEKFTQWHRKNLFRNPAI